MGRIIRGTPTHSKRRPFLNDTVGSEQETLGLTPDIDELGARDGVLEAVVQQRTLQELSRAGVPEIDAVAAVEVGAGAEHDVELRVVGEAQAVAVLAALRGNVEG